MPKSPRTPRRSTTTRQDAIDGTPTSNANGRPRSAYDPSSVQDRIRQWQAQGAADAPAPDAVSVRSIPTSVASSNLSRATSPAEDATKSIPARRNRWTTQALESPTTRCESRSSSAPRKRLISDEHWKANRRESSKRSPNSNRRREVVAPHHDLSYTSTQRKEEREGQRERRRYDRVSRENANDEGTNTPKGLNAYINGELAHRLSISSHNEDAEPRDGAEDHLETMSQRSFSMYDDATHTLTPSRYVDSLTRPEPLSLGSKRSTGGRILGRTREAFHKTDSTPTSNRVPSIQAWLEDQPDPFVEGGANVEADMPAAEVPKPLKRRSRRVDPTSDGRVVADPNQIWESVTTYRVRGQNSKRDLPSGPADLSSAPSRREDQTPAKTPDRDAEEGSPRSLRRRGAARTRRSTRSKSATQLPSCPKHALNSSPLPIDTDHASQPPALSPSRPQPPATSVSMEAAKELPDLPIPDTDEMVLSGTCDLKRRLTTHEDLMSVLSAPMHRKSTRSRRTAQNAQQRTATHVLETLVADEARYSKELRTLVDGVVPVLLQAVLSKSSTIAAAGLFSSTADPNDFSYTKPIIDMGIALERLKSLHARIPIQNIDALLAWAQNARRAYGDYIKAWRLGFQDVVVNLAPLDHGEATADPGMSRDTEGDIVDLQGEKVDVASLLKRPLVRVKNLAKTFESIKGSCNKPLAVEVSQAFTDLTSAARQRHREEQARLEDEAAATLDVSRARSVRTLGASSGVALNKTRKVRARDTFDLALWHTTGQRLDCQVEMIFRDDAADSLPGGDVLICEIDESGKWLLFPPIELSSISARRGEDDIDLVVMIRGPSSIGQEWHELLALKSEDPEAISEWMTMLGSCPLPPRLNRTRSFLERREAAVKEQKSRPTTADSKASTASASIVSEHDLPLGEPSLVGSKSSTSPSRAQRPLLDRFVPKLHLGGGLQNKATQPWSSPAKVPPRKPVPSAVSPVPSMVSEQSDSRIRGHKKSASVPLTPLPKPQNKDGDQESRSSPADELHMMSGALIPPDNTAVQNKDYNSSLLAEGTQPQARPDQPPALPAHSNSAPPERPGYARSLSATPSEGLPSIPKVRSKGPHDRDKSTVPLTNSIKDQWMSLSTASRNSQPRKESKTDSQSHTRQHATGMVQETGQSETTSKRLQAAAPLPPPHKEAAGARIQSTPVKSLERAPVLTPNSKAKRRSSSPLKHEYAPSTASDTSSDSESDDGTDASSETSDDFMSEVKDVSTPLVAVTVGNKRNSQVVRPPPARLPASMAAPSTGTRTLAPSDSASQGPYRRVPSSTTVPLEQKSRTIALICSWSDRGMWEQMHPDECSIVVSPGLIEAFQMSAAHSGERSCDSHEWAHSEGHAASERGRPLVAFELTPIVPLRRGTALDINIRSPPTPNSMLKTTNNILFRSRNADECDILYNMINWARCNNPTYIQLEKARPRQPPVSFNTGPTGHSRTRSGGSWFGFGSGDKTSSYRASSAPMSVGGETEGSNSTMATAFSALKRLGVSSAFNLKRSSVSRKTGRSSHTSGSLYSSNSGNWSGSGSSTPIPSQVGLVPGRDGPNVPTTSAEAANGGGMVNNMKIRLYVRKGQVWANLGSGRLSVLPAPETAVQTVDGPDREIASTNSSPVRGQPGTKGPRLASSGHTPHRLHGDGREKRIVVRKSKKDEVVLLDVVLGESCFERVMQTGIAIKVWTENAVVADTGGVMMGKEQIYMMQLPGTREAGWVFGLVGSYRYDTGP